MWARLGELQAENETAAAERDEARSAVKQLQALEADRVRAGPPASAGDRNPGNEDLDGERRPALHDLTRSDGPLTSTSHVQQAPAKEDIKAWYNPSTMKLWTLIGERPTVGGLEMPEMQAVLREIVKVTPAVADQLQSMSGFRVRRYVPENDDPRGTNMPLYEHLDIMIEAIVALLSLGIASDAGRVRLEILREGMEEGATLLRTHCRKWPAKMLDSGICAMMESVIEDDLGQ